MNFSKYQKLTHTTAVYPKEKGLEYLSLGVASEAGEIASLIKKYIRGDFESGDSKFYSILFDEIGDVLWYLSELCNFLEIDLEMAAVRNLEYLSLGVAIEKLQDRLNRGVIKGSGDKR